MERRAGPLAAGPDPPGVAAGPLAAGPDAPGVALVAGEVVVAVPHAPTTSARTAKAPNQRDLNMVRLLLDAQGRRGRRPVA
jgi:hypothetical protein